ncbi:MAG: GyrI-like domain-containing protein, partial [Candidatus Thorarchaeota archaeon]
MEKVDFKKELKEFYRPSAKKPVIVDVPPMNFLMIDGKGDPNTSQEYQEALEALYAVSYTLKFMLKNAGIVNYVVMPLEGLWWLEGEKEFDVTRKDDWKWTSMIMQPAQVNSNHVAESIELSVAKRDNPALSNLRFTDYHEGLSVQILHIGPWSEEAPT